jgi:hypothetical protein
MADLKEGGDAGGDGGNGEAVLTKTDDGIAFLQVSSGPNFLTSPDHHRSQRTVLLPTVCLKS